MDDKDILNILDKIYPQTDNLQQLTEQLTDLKKCLDSFRPLNQQQLHNLNSALDMEYTYESNRIEGNTLTLAETELVVNKGMTIGGKPIKDHQEAINHHEAVQFIREIARNEIDLDESVLLQIHRIVLAGIERENAGCYRSVRVRISGSRHICPNPLKVPYLMQEYFAYYEHDEFDFAKKWVSCNCD